MEKILTMKKFLFAVLLAAISLTLSAQPAAIDKVQSLRITGTDTVDVQAVDTYVLADLSSLSYTVRISAPTADYLGLRITFVQLNSAGGTQLTVAALGGGSHFHTSNTAASSVTWTANTFERRTFTCMQTGASTYAWVQVD